MSAPEGRGRNLVPPEVAACQQRLSEAIATGYHAETGIIYEPHSGYFMIRGTRELVFVGRLMYSDEPRLLCSGDEPVGIVGWTADTRAGLAEDYGCVTEQEALASAWALMVSDGRCV